MHLKRERLLRVFIGKLEQETFLFRIPQNLSQGQPGHGLQQFIFPAADVQRIAMLNPAGLKDIRPSTHKPWVLATPGQQVSDF